ncbi:uncharacterized protein K444DRAFT_279168 [Hyaloscypha bicolor E]|uniref:Transmembrane protein n=1 Tax=Hyaloscypha bicolor E TaxID=1095630 RepID=A0A2J6SH01_9HELO|nr:uncharacterized protein K444DRAFT_279168 [Hyaloscypha bicolor E]PMD50029.1 hypothetical protein K444DRAFT_279168 [Hyaloscypha bicolor E]
MFSYRYHTVIYTSISNCPSPNPNCNIHPPINRHPPNPHFTPASSSTPNLISPLVYQQFDGKNTNARNNSSLNFLPLLIFGFSNITFFSAFSVDVKLHVEVSETGLCGCRYWRW